MATAPRAGGIGGRTARTSTSGTTVTITGRRRTTSTPCRRWRTRMDRTTTTGIACLHRTSTSVAMTSRPLRPHRAIPISRCAVAMHHASRRMVTIVGT